MNNPANYNDTTRFNRWKDPIQNQTESDFDAAIGMVLGGGETGMMDADNTAQVAGQLALAIAINRLAASNHSKAD